MPPPSISVVVASYNHARYLRECIQSALHQTLAPCEVIVVDDGSVDESREIIRSFGDEVCPVFQENRGTYAALNAGYARASGSWVAIHNSDDVWEPEKLARQGALVEAHPDVALVHTGVTYIDAEGAPYHGPRAELLDGHWPERAEMLPTLLRIMPVAISSAMVRRDVWQALGGFDERFLGLGDWDFCLRLSRDHPIGFVSAPLARIRKHGTNAGLGANGVPTDWVDRDWQMLGGVTMPAAAACLVERARRGDFPRDEAAYALACFATIQSWGREPALARAMYRQSLGFAPFRWQTWLRYGVTFLPQRLRTRVR